MRGWRGWRGVAAVGLAAAFAAVGDTGAGEVRARVVPDQTILLLLQELAPPTGAASDGTVVVYGGSPERELLRQIAGATRAAAHAQIELLRQQNEIIRLLEALADRPRSGR